jgi:hypothetical protein
MNIESEITILDEAISKLGTRSYFGPWLAEIRAELIASAKSDLIPALTNAQSQAVAKEIVANAERLAEATVTRAQARVKVIEEEATQKALQIRAETHSLLTQLISKL